MVALSSKRFNFIIVMYRFTFWQFHKKRRVAPERKSDRLVSGEQTGTYEYSPFSAEVSDDRGGFSFRRTVGRSSVQQ